MPDPYPVVEVQAEWLLDEPEEEMGSKRKFWYREEEDGSDWLFKFPRPDTGEHWAEKIAAEVANLLGIPHAPVELARFGNDRGSTSESFTPKGYELVHGNQLLERVVFDYNPDLTFGQSDHTLANILAVMERAFVADEAKKLAKLRVAEYFVLDALIGNTDRHHENWGIVRRRDGDQWRGGVAPSFDHASSLGRELLDERRRVFLVQNEVGKYVAKGRGAVFWSGDERRGPSPLALVGHAMHLHPDLFSPALARLDRLKAGSITRMVDRVPEDWMSASEREFALGVMHSSLEQLRVMDR